MYVVAVSFEVHPEHVSAFRDAMLRQASNSLAREESCRQFDVCFDHQDGTKCFLYEKYDSRKAFEAHLASEHFNQFDKKVAAWLKSKSVETWKQEN